MQPLQPALSGVSISFANGGTANAIQVERWQDLPAALAALGLNQLRPVLVLMGGAGHLDRHSSDRLQHLFVNVLAPLAETLGMTVVDGGTNAGIMQLMGLARAKIAATFPLVGVAPVGKVSFPNPPSSSSLEKYPDRHPLEPHHTHFVLVPGNLCGDESPWMAQTASLLASQTSSISVLINGGRVSLIDVQESIAGGRPVVVITGTGRLADEIAAAVAYPEQMREAIVPVVRSGCLMLCQLSEAETQLTKLLNHYLR